jgi:murein DD-endopeptidase MepM/ murein hydrolase activator NlpD
MYYKVSPGDTLTSIAAGNALPAELIVAFNPPLEALNQVVAGQEIYIPNLDDIPADAKLTTGVTASALVARARTAVGKKIRYKLGEGGMNPKAKLPTANNLCDCSGFVCWVLGLSRKSDIPFYKKYGGWIYTDSMVADVRSDAGIFEKLNVPEVGCIVVYGAGAAIGHVGLVSEVTNGKMKKVIHCSSGNDSKFSDSIQETAPAVFDRADALWGRFALP